MIPFVLDNEGVAELHRIRDHANSHPITFYNLKKMMEGMMPVAGDDDDLVCFLPPRKDWTLPKFKVVFSVEQQPAANVRHLSISITESDRMPSPHAVSMIMKELGFTHELKECKIWIEEDYKAVNVLEMCE